MVRDSIKALGAASIGLLLAAVPGTGTVAVERSVPAWGTSTSASTDTSTPQSAQLVILNGKVFTADAHSSLQQAFAVKDQKFIAVGSTREIRRYVGSQTRVVDLKGRFVSPGLTDDHFHGEGGGPGIDLSHVRTLAELLTVVANAAAAAPKGELLISNSDWHEAQLKEQRLPTATELSQAAPDNPVVLVRGGHSLILNRKALERFHITPETPVPAGGGISRDTSGQLTGEIFDTAKRLVDLPEPKPVTMQDVLATQKALNAYGITAVRIPGAYTKGDLLAAYHLMKQAEEAGTLSVRYTVFIPGFGLRSAAQVHELVNQWGFTWTKAMNGCASVASSWVLMGVSRADTSPSRTWSPMARAGPIQV